MKTLGVIMFISLPLLLTAVIDFDNEYIGPGQPGQWHKTRETSNRYIYGSEGSTTSYVDYYYNPYNIAQLDSVSHYSSGEYSGGSIDKYFYTDYPEYREVRIETWTSDDWAPIPYLSQTSTYRYDYNGNKIYWANDPAQSRIRIYWTYDEANNCLSETEYRDSYHIDNPFQTHTYTYDDQNRNVSTDYTFQNVHYYHTTSTWTNHCLPDSIYYQRFVYHPSIEYKVNGFDELGFHNYTKVLSYNGAFTDTWFREDTTYDLVYAHNMAFHTHKLLRSGTLSSPDSEFVPSYTTSVDYTYTNDYHSVSYYYQQHEAYSFNNAWYQTGHSSSDESGIYSHSTVWNYYGSTNSDDYLTPSEPLFCYPNPAQGELSICIDKTRANSPIRIKVFNLRGQLIRELQSPEIRGTELRYLWDCKDSSDDPVPNGLYIIRCESDAGSQYRKVTIIN